MHFYNTLILCAALLATCFSHTQHNRQKRFLRGDFLNPLSDSFQGLSEYAREFSDEITSRASLAVQHMVPHARRAASDLTNLGSRISERVVDSLQRKGLMREREMEGDDREVEVFTPDVEEPLRKPPPQGSGVGLNPFIPFQFSFGFMTPWWDGPNVCVERNEIEEPDKETSDLRGLSINFATTQCVPNDSAYVCTRKIQTNGMRKTVVIRRQCCHGFVKRRDGRPGCSALKMDDLIDTMKTLEMNRFKDLIDAARLTERLKSGNFTVFTPSNDAIIDYEDESEDNEISAIDPVKRLTDPSSVVSGHIVEGFHNIDSLENEQLLESIEEPKSKIRINKYRPSHEVVTANCIPVSGKNNFATNGIIHLTSGVLPQPKKTLGELIEDDEGFSKFKSLLMESGMLEDLKKQDKAWTLFVPTDAAFDELPLRLKKQLESGDGCVQSILHQHILKGTICTPAVVSHIRVVNILDNNLQLTKDETEKLRVDGALIESENLVGTNGVMHVIDKVLIPPQARSLLKVLEEEERTDLLDLFELNGMISELEESANITFFMPSKEAIKTLSNETREEMMAEPELLKQVLQQHLVQSHMPSSTFRDNKKLTTLNGQNVHMKLHEVFPGIVTAATIQCAYVINYDNQACGAVIHKINKVLMPPKGNIVHTLKGMEGHDIVMKLLKNTDLETKLNEEGPFTFLAPTDEAFENLREHSVEDLLQNNTLATEVLKQHILPEVLCCNGVSHASPFNQQFVRTISGTILPTHRGLKDSVRFGRARVTRCDTPATNGLVHSINRVIFPEKPRATMFGMDLWPFL